MCVCVCVCVCCSLKAYPMVAPYRASRVLSHVLPMSNCMATALEPWASRWHGGKKNFATLLLQDKRIREHIIKEYGSAGIPRIEIERTGEAVNVIIYSARPGVLVGRKGVRIDQLKARL